MTVRRARRDAFAAAKRTAGQRWAVGGVRSTASAGRLWDDRVDPARASADRRGSAPRAARGVGHRLRPGARRPDARRRIGAGRFGGPRVLERRATEFTELSPGDAVTVAARAGDELRGRGATTGDVDDQALDDDLIRRAPAGVGAGAAAGAIGAGGQRVAPTRHRRSSRPERRRERAPTGDAEAVAGRVRRAA